MLKSWIVFPPDVQPTIAQAKIWNSHVHELRGVHWGTQHDQPNVLAVEVESESLYSQIQHCEALEALIDAWLRRGAELRDNFDFIPDRNALKPTKSGRPISSADVTVVPSTASFWERKHRPPAESESSGIASSHPPAIGRKGIPTRHSSHAAPWLLVAIFSAMTIAVGTYVATKLKQAGVESRRDTIERIDGSTRSDPRVNVSPNTRVSSQGQRDTASK